MPKPYLSPKDKLLGNKKAGSRLPDISIKGNLPARPELDALRKKRASKAKVPVVISGGSRG